MWCGISNAKFNEINTHLHIYLDLSREYAAIPCKGERKYTRRRYTSVIDLVLKPIFTNYYEH